MHKNFKTIIFFLCAMEFITVSVMATSRYTTSSSMSTISMSTSSVSTGVTASLLSSGGAVTTLLPSTEIKAAVRSRDWLLLNQVCPLPVYTSDVTRNLIVIINTNVELDIDLCITMLALALQSKAAPIIVSGTTLQSFLHIQRKKEFNDIIDALGRTKGSWRLGDTNNPLPTKLPKDLSARHIAIGLIPFSESDWYGYINKQSDFVLLIPKQYVARASTKTPAFDCGFNEQSLELLDFKEPQIGSVDSVGTMMKGLYSMFETKSLRAQAGLSSNVSLSWKIYCVGHGMPAGCRKGSFTGDSVFVCGLLYEYFVDFIRFLSKELSVSFFHYLSCYSGGRNQDVINHVLSYIDPAFFVASYGTGDLTTTIGSLASDTHGMNVDSDGKGCLQLSSPYSFGMYFSLMNTYFLNPQKLVTIASSLGLSDLDPLVVAMYGLMDTKTLVDFNTQPFIRKPHGQQFDALAVTNDTVIVTERLLAEHIKGDKPIDARAAALLIAYPQKIEVPLVMGPDTVFISRLPNEVACSKDASSDDMLTGRGMSVSTTYTAKHQFVNVTAEAVDLWRLISNMVRCNGMYQSTFIIDTLSCKNYTNSGVVTQGIALQASNVTITVKGIEGTYTYGDWGKQIYPGIITISLSIGQTRYAATWNRKDLHATIDNADGLHFEVQSS